MNVRNLALYLSLLISLNGQSMSADSENDHQALMKEMSNMAMKSAQQAVDRLVQEGAKGWGLAMQLLHLGSLQLRDKQTDAALKTFERALKEVDSSKEEGIGGLAVDIHICIADCYEGKNDIDTAQKHLQSAMQFAVTAPHPESEQMKVLDHLAANALLAQKYAEAESYLEKRHQLYKKLFPEYEDDAGINRSLLAEIKSKQGKKQEAEALYKHVLAECPDSIADLRRYATLLRETNRAAEADALEKKADELQQHGENFSLNAFTGMMGMQAHQQAAESSDWGQELKAADDAQKSGDFDKALAGYRSVLDTLSKRGQIGEYRSQAWERISLRAHEYQEKHDFAKAAALMELAAEHAVEAEGQCASAALTIANLGSALMNAGKLAESEQAYRKAVNLFSKTEPPDDQWYCYTLNDLALCLQKQKKFDEAEKTYKDVTTNHINESMNPTGARAVALLQSLLEYAVMMNELGKSPQADALIARAKNLLKVLEPQDEASRLDSVIEMHNVNGKVVEVERGNKVKKLYLAKLLAK